MIETPLRVRAMYVRVYSVNTIRATKCHQIKTVEHAMGQLIHDLIYTSDDVWPKLLKNKCRIYDRRKL